MPIQLEKKFECYKDGTYLMLDLEINNHTDLVYVNLFNDHSESMSVALTQSDIEELVFDLIELKNKMKHELY
jgi:hypothetical protein